MTMFKDLDDKVCTAASAVLEEYRATQEAQEEELVRRTIAFIRAREQEYSDMIVQYFTEHPDSKRVDVLLACFSNAELPKDRVRFCDKFRNDGFLDAILSSSRIFVMPRRSVEYELSKNQIDSPFPPLLSSLPSVGDWNLILDYRVGSGSGA